MLKQTLKRIFSSKFKYQPLIKVLVFKNNLLDNLKLFQDKFPAVHFAPVLKSNAYGHGLAEVGKILDGQNSPFFVVDSFYEALILRNNGIKTKILVIGYSTEEHIQASALKDVSFAVVSFGQLQELSQNILKPISIHLKIDTGMHRQGVLLEQTDQVISLIKANSNLKLEGICSHLADADGKDQGFTEKQISEWNGLVQKFKLVFPEIKYWHLSNSAGAVFSQKINANVVRLGISLYGFDQSGKMPGLKPCLALKTIVSGVKEIKPGEYIGYNITFQAKASMKIAVLPVGYYEGMDRRLSNSGWVKIQEYFCPILGRVSMNLTVVDVTQVPTIKLGDEVLVISQQFKDKNSVLALAQTCNTIVYEILVHLPQHLRREVIYE